MKFFLQITHYLVILLVVLYWVIGGLALYFIYDQVKDQVDAPDSENPLNTDFIIFGNFVLLVLGVVILVAFGFGLYFDHEEKSKSSLVIDGIMIISMLIGFIFILLNIIYFINILKDKNYDKAKDVNIFLKADTHVYANVLVLVLNFHFMINKIHSLVYKLNVI